jgi:hypothetical protein
MVLRSGLLHRIAVQADGQPLPVNVIHYVAAHYIRQVRLLCLEPPCAAAPFRDEEIPGLVGAANQVLPVARDPLIDLSLHVPHGSLLFSIRAVDDPLGQESVVLKMENVTVFARDNFHQSSGIIQSV